MSNPKVALAAITASGRKVGKWTVREITLGLSAVLESIESPLDTGIKPKGIRDWLPTLFALTHSTAESELILADGLEAYRKAASEWADKVTIFEAKRMIEACQDAAKRLVDATDVGESSEDEEGNAPAATVG